MAPYGASLRARGLARLLAVGLLLSLVLGALGAPSALAQEVSTDVPMLYLTERPFEHNRDRWNFTVFPADPDEAGKERRAEQASFPTFRGHWNWFLASAPANWSVSSGTQWEAELAISGLDEVHPLPTPASILSGTLGYHLQLEIFIEQRIFAEGSTQIPLTDLEEGVQMHRVSATFREGFSFREGADPDLVIQISLSGRGSEPESPLKLHFGSSAHPSSLRVPEYPVDAFLDLELDYLLAKECQQLILQQRSCAELQRRQVGPTDPEKEEPTEEDPDPNDNQSRTEESDDEEVHTTPGPMVLVGPGVAMLLGLWARRHSPRHQGTIYFQGEPAGGPVQPSR